MADNDSIKKTLLVSISLCLVCSVVVSVAAVTLRPLQEANKSVDKQRNILAVAGLLDQAGDKSPRELFDQYVETKLINLETGEYVEDMDPLKYNQREAAKKPATSKKLPADIDRADIKRQAKYAPVYLVKRDGKVQYYILPVHGYGLWSTMYGFIALKSDLNTVHGISFYDHAETPGLGGEIDNPKWQAKWRGKKIYDVENGLAPELNVIKGAVDAGTANAEHKVDGIGGATLTSRGVGNMVQFWFGQHGYKPYLKRLKERRG